MVNVMATYQILCWKDIPTQIKVKDDNDEIKTPLDPRLMELIDEQAMSTGEANSDAYLEAWSWSAPEEREGTAEEVTNLLKAELEKKYLGG